MQVRRLWDQLGFTDGLPKEKMGLFISGMNAALKVCAARLRCSRRAQRVLASDVRAGRHIGQARSRPGRQVLHRLAVATCDEADGPGCAARTNHPAHSLAAWQTGTVLHVAGLDRRQHRRLIRRSRGPQCRQRLGSQMPVCPDLEPAPSLQPLPTMCLYSCEHACRDGGRSAKRGGQCPCDRQPEAE